MTTSAPLRSGLLQLRWAVEPSAEVEFHRWYDEEHLADLCSVPGVLSGRRFRRVSAPYSSPTPYGDLTLYELACLDVFATPAYRRLAEQPSEWTRRMATMLPMTREVAEALTTARAESGSDPRGAAIVHVLTRAEDAILAEFHAWYEEEHVPALVSVPGVRSARRYRIVTPERGEFAFVAIYELDAMAVALGDEWMKQGRSTPRRERMGGRMQSHVQVYEEIRRREGRPA